MIDQEHTTRPTLPPQPNLIEQVVRALVLYSLAEVQQGHARVIRVAVGGSTFQVEDDGRGHAISRSIEGAPYLQLIYQHLDHAFEPGHPRPVQLQGLGMSLINTICEELSVQVSKPNAQLRMKFQDSQLIKHEYADCVPTQSGNLISGRVAARYESRPVDVDALEQWLLSVAAAHPSLSLHFNDRQLSAASQADGKP